jgi:hypothetical protein
LGTDGSKAKDEGIDQTGNELAPMFYTNQDGSITGCHVRWREEDEDGIYVAAEQIVFSSESRRSVQGGKR